MQVVIKKNIFKEGYKMSYVDEVLVKVKEKNASETRIFTGS